MSYSLTADKITALIQDSGNTGEVCPPIENVYNCSDERRQDAGNSSVVGVFGDIFGSQNSMIIQEPHDIDDLDINESVAKYNIEQQCLLNLSSPVERQYSIPGLVSSSYNSTTSFLSDVSSHHLRIFSAFTTTKLCKSFAEKMHISDNFASTTKFVCNAGGIIGLISTKAFTSNINKAYGAEANIAIDSFVSMIYPFTLTFVPQLVLPYSNQNLYFGLAGGYLIKAVSDYFFPPMNQSAAIVGYNAARNDLITSALSICLPNYLTTKEDYRVSAYRAIDVPFNHWLTTFLSEKSFEPITITSTIMALAFRIKNHDFSDPSKKSAADILGTAAGFVIGLLISTNSYERQLVNDFWDNTCSSISYLYNIVASSANELWNITSDATADSYNMLFEVLSNISEDVFDSASITNEGNIDISELSQLASNEG
jgi:hypothetical protein